MNIIARSNDDYTYRISQHRALSCFVFASRVIHIVAPIPESNGVNRAASNDRKMTARVRCACPTIVCR